MQIPPRLFRGFVWQPRSEQEVVVLYGRLIERERCGASICIERVRTTLPDCTAFDAETGTRINIEFEYRRLSERGDRSLSADPSHFRLF